MSEGIQDSSQEVNPNAAAWNDQPAPVDKVQEKIDMAAAEIAKFAPVLRMTREELHAFSNAIPYSTMDPQERRDAYRSLLEKYNIPEGTTDVWVDTGEEKVYVGVTLGDFGTHAAPEMYPKTYANAPIDKTEETQS